MVAHVVAPRGPTTDAPSIRPTVAQSAVTKTWRRTGVWPDSVQVSGGTLSIAAARPLTGVALIWTARSGMTAAAKPDPRHESA